MEPPEYSKMYVKELRQIAADKGVGLTQPNGKLLKKADLARSLTKHDQTTLTKRAAVLD